MMIYWQTCFRFGMAPALAGGITWALSGEIGWLAAFVYVACAALRLARFNTQNRQKADNSFFQGLASPAAARHGCWMVWVGIDIKSMATNMVSSSL